MTKEIKRWWESASKEYQKVSKIPIDIHYGPGSPNEKTLKLIGNVKNKRVLEIGCGGAQCSIAFAKQGAKVTAIDISEEQLKFAKALANKHRVQIKFYRGDMIKLPQIKSKSQNVVFSAFALPYVNNLVSCFKEIKRVLKDNGKVVFSLDHPLYRLVDPKTLKLRKSYFDTGKNVEESAIPFISYYRKFSDVYNSLVEAGLFVEQIIEPDSRKRYSYDPWYGLWDYNPRLLSKAPPTIIFKCRKMKNSK